MASIVTVLGPLPVSQLGIILPHEHIFTDLRGPNAPDYAQGDPAEVARRLQPFIEEIKAQGVTALVEASTGGVGRNIQVLHAVAEATGLAIVAPAGAYREAFIPDPLRSLPQPALTDWLLQDLTAGVEDTGIRAGFIKLASSDGGLTPLEERLLRAAAQASRRTGAAIASHTITGLTALRQAGILIEEGLDLERFIWVHAHAEPDVDLHLRLAELGVYLEYDAIGSETPDSHFIGLICQVWDSGYSSRILLSQDAGWYHAGEPEAPIRGYGYLLGTFVPALRQAGFGEAEIGAMIRENPQRAFAIE